MSFRAKLTVWYSLCLGVLFAVFGYSAHLAMLRSSIDTVDRSLTSRMSDVRDFIQRQAGRGERSLVHELKEQASLGLGGGLLELWDQDGKLLYRSPRAVRGELGADITSLKNISIRGPTDLATGRGTNRIVSGIESFGPRSYV